MHGRRSTNISETRLQRFAEPAGPSSVKWIPTLGSLRLEHLQGGWYRKADGVKLGDLIDDFLLWDARMKIKAPQRD